MLLMFSMPRHAAIAVIFTRFFFAIFTLFCHVTPDDFLIYHAVTPRHIFYAAAISSLFDYRFDVAALTDDKSNGLYDGATLRCC